MFYLQASHRSVLSKYSTLQNPIRELHLHKICLLSLGSKLSLINKVLIAFLSMCPTAGLRAHSGVQLDNDQQSRCKKYMLISLSKCKLPTEFWPTCQAVKNFLLPLQLLHLSEMIKIKLHKKQRKCFPKNEARCMPRKGYAFLGRALASFIPFL